MDRRLRAYTTFVASLLAGIALSSLDYLRSAPVIWLACFAGLALALALSRIGFAGSFRNYSLLQLRLTDSGIERARGTSLEEFAFVDIVGLSVVRTARRSIREITARLGDGRRLSLNGLEDFERLERELRSRIPADAAVSEAREPVDYDHPLFYVVFGSVTGLAFTLAIRAMSTIGENGLKWTFFGIACYAIVLGAYVLFTKPISQRYGPRSRFGDMLLGLLMLLAGAVLAARSLFGFGK